MKVAVSNLKSKYMYVDTIDRINETECSYLHIDVMDGKYVENIFLDKKKLRYSLLASKKNIDVHLMVARPKKYLKFFSEDRVKIIYFHPHTTKRPKALINKITRLDKSPGIVINPDEEITDFEKILKKIDYILVMSVHPGKGGQEFMKTTTKKIKEISEYIKKNDLEIKIAVDGGIDDKSIKNLKKLNIDYVVSGTYVCESEDFEKQVETLKKN